MSVDYGVKDIKTLEGIEAIRLRPGIIKNTILNLKCPFNLTDVFYLLPDFPKSTIKRIIDDSWSCKAVQEGKYCYKCQ